MNENDCKRVILCVSVVMAMLCFSDQVPHGSFSNAIENAFVPDPQTGVIGVKAVRRLIESIESVHDLSMAQRYEIESNICWRTLDFPLTTNAHTTTWALSQKRFLLFDMAALGYWQGNRIAMLQLADHLGTHSAVTTNSFQAEFSKADELDRIELDKAREQYKASGTWPSNFTRESLCFRRRQVRKRLQLVKIWNEDVRQYRGWVFGAFSKVILSNVNGMPLEGRNLFCEEFIRRGRLSPDEVKRVFGSLPESSDGTSGGPATNISTNDP